MRLRRVERELSQQQLGAKVGLTFQQIQKYEKGSNRIGAGRLEKFAAILDTPIEYFFNNHEVSRGQKEVEQLIYYDPNFSLRLLRAYTRLDTPTQRAFVHLMESVAANNDK